MAVILTLCVVGSNLSASPVLAQSALCDSRLNTPNDQKLQYRLRGGDERCEGLYIQKVSSATLQMASFTRFFEDYDLGKSMPLQASWKAPSGTDSVFIRASSLKRRVNYRMDTVRPSDDSGFTWPLEVLSDSRLQLPREQMGVLGWTTASMGGQSREILLPLRIDQQGTSSAEATGGGYDLMLVPKRELHEIYVSVAETDSAGQPLSYLSAWDGKQLGHARYYPEHLVPVEIPFGTLPGPGVYLLEVSAQIKGGGVTSFTYLFYHPES